MAKKQEKQSEFAKRKAAFDALPEARKRQIVDAERAERASARAKILAARLPADKKVMREGISADQFDKLDKKSKKKIKSLESHHNPITRGLRQKRGPEDPVTYPQLIRRIMLGNPDPEANEPGDPDTAEALLQAQVEERSREESAKTAGKPRVTKQKLAEQDLVFKRHNKEIEGADLVPIDDIFRALVTDMNDECAEFLPRGATLSEAWGNFLSKLYEFDQKADQIADPKDRDNSRTVVRNAYGVTVEITFADFVKRLNAAEKRAAEEN